MEKALEDFLSTLPAKRPRSRLSPYTDLIGELRKRGWTYRDITKILEECCAIRVSASNLHHFVKVRNTEYTQQDLVPAAKPSLNRDLHSSSTPKHPPQDQHPDEIARRIQALKQRAPTSAHITNVFEYDESEPLSLNRSGKRL